MAMMAGNDADDGDDSFVVLVYDYESWDPQLDRMVVSDRSATLEAIRRGLGRPIVATGRKVPVSLLDGAGTVPRVSMEPAATEPQGAESEPEVAPAPHAEAEQAAASSPAP